MPESQSQFSYDELGFTGLLLQEIFVPSEKHKQFSSLKELVDLLLHLHVCMCYVQREKYKFNYV